VDWRATSASKPRLRRTWKSVRATKRSWPQERILLLPSATSRHEQRCDPGSPVARLGWRGRGIRPHARRAESHQSATADRKGIEGHERRGRLTRELLHPRSGRVQAHLERIEVEALRCDDDDLAVDHAAFRKARGERIVQLGEVAIEGTEVAALNEDV